MNNKKKNYRVASLLSGAAVGFLASAIVSFWMNKNSTLTSQQRRNAALDAALKKARKAGAISLNNSHRYIIFSDHHKGGHDLADEFNHSEPTYLAAMDYYYNKGYTVVILGDAEEHWENKVSTALQTYGNVFTSEARFYPKRYIRLYGNHDNGWKLEALVRQYLYKYFPNIKVKKELLFNYSFADGKIGEILLVHGHQGTLASDTFDFIPPLVLPLYRVFQNLTNLGHYSPSKDACMRGLHDTQMYKWASSKKNLILITGHTHRPVWSSLTHLDKLVMELHHLQRQKPGRRPKDYSEKLGKILAEIRTRAEKYPPCNDTVKTKPCYFNTGCCCFEDGDITGIEINRGKMSLVKWCQGDCDQPDIESGYARTVLESQQLEEIYKIQESTQNNPVNITG